MNFFKKFVETFKLFWNSIAGRMVATTISELVNTVGRSYADKLTIEAQKRAKLIEAEFPGEPGSVKREQLANYLGDYATGLGLNIGASLLNLVIEIVVNNLNNESK